MEDQNILSGFEDTEIQSPFQKTMEAPGKATATMQMEAPRITASNRQMKEDQKKLPLPNQRKCQN